WRFAITPCRNLPAKILGQTALPDNLAILDLQASQLALHAQDVQPVPIDRWCTARSFLRLRHPLPVYWPQGSHPQITPILFGQRPYNFLVAERSHDEDSSIGNRRSTVAAAESWNPPG